MNTRSILVTALALSLSASASTVEARHRHQRLNEVNELIWATEDRWEPEGFDTATVVAAPYSKASPAIDGVAADPAWAAAPSVTVSMSMGTVREATIKALHTDSEVFLLVSWPDSTKSDRHRPWEWSAARNRYEESPEFEDSLLVSFEAGCEWTPSLLSGYVYDFDGWRWLAARTDPLGQAVDVSGHTQDRWIPDSGYVRYKARATGPTWQLKFQQPKPGTLYTPWEEFTRVYMLQPIAEDIYVAYEADGYRPPPFFARIEPPPAGVAPAMEDSALGANLAHAATTPPTLEQFQPVKLPGDAGEVRAKGQWADGRWTVEFARALETPARTQTDVVFGRMVQFSLHAFDHTERVDESSESGRLWLQFLPAGAQSAK